MSKQQDNKTVILKKLSKCTLFHISILIPLDNRGHLNEAQSANGSEEGQI